jgi:stringent starvation protein B
MSDLEQMSSTKPYLTRAIYEWILDNGLTPHLMVDANYPGTEVPQAYVQDGQIILNIAPTAVRDLLLGNDWISFGARFGGTPFELMIPAEAVLGIFSRENRQGMVFPPPDYPDAAPDAQAGPRPVPSIGEDGGGDTRKPPSKDKSKGGPRLKVVK